MEEKNKYIFKEVCMNIFVNCIFIFIGYFEYYLRVEWNVLWIFVIIFRRLKKVFKK